MSIGINTYTVRRVRTIKEAIAELEELAKCYGIPIKPAKENCLNFNKEDKPIQITYTSPQKLRTRLWAIAHELGHLIAIVDNTNEKLAKKFSTGRSNSFWELEAELQAWNIADSLLEQLNSKFYDEGYIKWKHECLKTFYRF